MTLFEVSTQNLRHRRDFQELVSIYRTGKTKESSEKKSLLEFIGCSDRHVIPKNKTDALRW